MADGRHFENRYIAIYQRKLIRFRWNFVHSSRFRTVLWTLRDQKWKSCIGQTPSSTERISCLYSVTSVSYLPVRTIWFCSVVFGVMSRLAVIYTIHGRSWMCIARDRAWLGSLYTVMTTMIAYSASSNTHSPIILVSQASNTFTKLRRGHPLRDAKYR